MAGTQNGSSTNFPQGFANGLSVRGMPLTQMQPGQVFFVGNGPALSVGQKPGSDGNRGTFLDPFATLNYAVNTACMPGRGDIVFVEPGHRETISSAAILLLNASGVAVIGLGSGNQRPTFTFTTATTANIPVGGAAMSVQNCLFVGNFLSVASVFTAVVTSFTGVISDTTLTTSAVTGTIQPGMTIAGTGVTSGTVILAQLSGTTGGAGTYSVSVSGTVASVSMTTSPVDFAIDNCEFRDTSGVLGFLSIFTTSATANASDRFSMTRCTWNSQSTVSPTVALVVGAVNDGWQILDNIMYSPITAVTQGAILIAAGANSLTTVNIGRNRTARPNTSSTIACAISSSGTAWTGNLYDNYFSAAPSGTGVWATTGMGQALGMTGNYSRITGTADKQNTLNPLAT